MYNESLLTFNKSSTKYQILIEMLNEFFPFNIINMKYNNLEYNLIKSEFRKKYSLVECHLPPNTCNLYIMHT